MFCTTNKRDEPNQFFSPGVHKNNSYPLVFISIHLCVKRAMISPEILPRSSNWAHFFFDQRTSRSADISLSTWSNPCARCVRLPITVHHVLLHSIRPYRVARPMSGWPGFWGSSQNKNKLDCPGNGREVSSAGRVGSSYRQCGERVLYNDYPRCPCQHAAVPIISARLSFLSRVTREVLSYSGFQRSKKKENFRFERKLVVLTWRFARLSERGHRGCKLPLAGRDQDRFTSTAKPARRTCRFAK